MSVYGLFMQADWVVKAVMIALLLASFWSWAIIFEKMIRLRALKQSAQAFEDTFWSGVSLEDLYDRVGAKPDDPMSSIFSAAMREWRRSVSKGLAATATARSALRQRIEQVMGVTIQREMEAIEKRLGFLATVGANATFVGLFGTVWGIMNSFGHIAVSKNTSLAVVAPGISEALFATAIGLVAAIPAAGAYNILSGQVSRYAQQLEAFAGEFITILSRQLEEQG
jgi:biopolymer transport protein TolQ